MMRPVSNTLRALLAALAISFVASCGSGDDGAPPQTAVTAPTITTQPANATVTEPAAATFTVAASGSAPLTYQWQRNVNGTWTDISGATAASYTTPATARPADDGAQFRVAISNSVGSVTSNVATMIVGLANPANVVGASGGTLTFLNGAVTLVFPAGAVSSDTTIAVSLAASSALFPAPLNGTIYEFQPSMTFAQPVRVTLKYDAAQLPVQMDAQTLHVGKVTADGWISIDSVVDTAAGTVAADLTSFSQYALIPGWDAWQFGAVPGMAARYYDWPDVSNLQIASDPSGAVYIVGRSGSAGATQPPVGAFVARLNSALAVEWIKLLPGTLQNAAFVLRADQQGNAYVGYTVSSSAGPTVQVMGYNANGTARTGFPVQSKVAGQDEIRGMAIDGNGDLHVFGAVGPLFAVVLNGSYAVVRGGDGTFARAPVMFTLPRGPSVSDLTPWDITLDKAGNVYFTSTWFGNSTPAFGAYVSSFAATSLAPRAGFPLAFPSRLLAFFARPVNSQANMPLQIVPITGSLAGAWDLTALSVATGDVAAGFPAPLTGMLGVSYSAIDLSSNTWQLGLARTAQNKNKVWLGSVNSSGQMRSGFPRMSGASADTDEFVQDLTVDAGGAAYVIGRQQVTPTADYRVFILRQPAL